MGRTKEPQSSYVWVRLSNDASGVRDESRKESKVRSGIRSGLCWLGWMIFGTALGGLMWVECCNFKKYCYYFSIHSEYKALF